MPDPENNETEEERFDRMYAARRKAEQDAASRDERLKKAGLTDDIMDALADRFWDRGEARAEARRKAAEDADQSPATGKGEKRRGGLFGLIPADD